MREVELRRALDRAEEHRVRDADDGHVLLEEAVEVGADRRTAARVRCPACEEPRAIAARELAGGLLEDGGQHAFLAAEVVVERRLGDARHLDDFADRRGRVALPVEDADGGAEQPRPRLLVLFGRRDVRRRGAGERVDCGFVVGRREAGH